MDISSIKRVLKKLEELRAKAGVILARMCFLAKTLLTKYKPVPLTKDGIISLLRICKIQAEELSKESLLQRSGLWMWCLECFDLVLIELKSNLYLQEALSSLAYLIRGFNHLIESINNVIYKILIQSKLNTL